MHEMAKVTGLAKVQPESVTSNTLPLLVVRGLQTQTGWFPSLLGM